MEINETVKVVLAVVGALGGIEGVKYFLNLRANRRKAESEATKATNTVLDDYVEGWKGLYEEVKSENKAQKELINSLYKEVKELRIENTSVKVQNKELQYDRCTVSNCLTRQPPRSATMATVKN